MLISFLLAMTLAPTPPALVPGAVLRQSTTLRRQEALLPDSHEDGSGAALTIQGDHLTIDFGGTTLRGTPADAEPDRRKGTGILIRGDDITLKNVRVRGYKIGILARDCRNLRIENADCSYNWKQRLGSTAEKEDESDWMSFHHNERDEWLGYGAGIYLRGCDRFTIRKCRVRGGQCGLMLTRCNRGLVAESDFSFLSGIGLGLYRSSENRVLHNKIDWCVRGYSHGVYNRGQDSAGILIYEQSSRNVFAYNSVTHGGDGFFLWAGQTTMDTGQGGCDDNLVYGNDFSHAPTNGIEATFSRNIFANNRVLECWHGVWGGFSYESRIVGNLFGYNAQAIAIEHGRDNAILGNTFLRDREAIALWKNATLDPSWGYPRHHETTSRDYTIARNRFVNVAKSLTARGTTGIRESANETTTARPALPPTMESSGLTVAAQETDPAEYRKRWQAHWDPRAAVEGVAPPAPLPGVKDPFLPPNALRGRRYLIVDEWGPYDFRRPLLWPRGDGVYEILGPPGKWRLLAAEGASVSESSATVPGMVRIVAPPGKAGTTRVEMEYIGAATVDYRGIATPAGKPVRFGFSHFFAPIDWKVSFFAWEKDRSDPRTQPDAFAALLKGTPLATLTTDRLDFAGRFAATVPGDYFATVAEGEFTIPPGDYTLEITTDDGCRAWLDGKLILADAWKYQGPTLYPIPVTLGGTHHLRVEHFQIDGYAALKVNLRPRPMGK